MLPLEPVPHGSEVPVPISPDASIESDSSEEESDVTVEELYEPEFEVSKQPLPSQPR